jgi:hypothetical protein
MGINFGRIAQGLATGYLGAAIKDKESKDNARLEVVKAAGIDYYTNQLPAHKKSEENRAQTYNQLSKMFGSEEAADYFDANGFITGDGKDLERITKMLEDKNIKPGAFKDYIPTSNYSERYKTRQTDFETRFEPVAKTLTMQQGGLGKSTVDGLLTKPEGDITTTEQVTTPAVEPQQIEGTPIMTSGTPERTEEVTTTLPRSTADSAMSEFFIPKTTVSNLGKENDIASSLSSYRGFGEGISIDPVTKNVRLSFGGSKNTEYNAMKQVLDQLGSQYEQADGKVNLTAASAEADRVLYNQTQGIIKNNIVTGYSEASDGKNIISSATGFNETFNSDYPDARSKKIALINHMQSLGSKQEQLYFALSFPADLKFDDGKLVQGILTKAVQ